MLTEAANEANAAVMLSIAQIAERDRVSKPTVSNHVKRLVEKHGLRVERDGQGRVARLNVAEYDALRNRFADPSKVQAPAAERGSAYGDDSYDEALRRKTFYEAEKRRLELDQLRGRMIDATGVADALDRASDAAKEPLAALEDYADDVAAAVARDGARGARAELVRIGAAIIASQFAAFEAEAKKLRASIREEMLHEGSERQQ